MGLLVTVLGPLTRALFFEVVYGSGMPQAPSGTPRKSDRSDRPMQAVVSTMASIVVSDDTIETDVKIIIITYAAVYSIHIQILV